MVRKFILCYRIAISLDAREFEVFYYIWFQFFFFFNNSKVSLHGVLAKQRFVDPNGNYTGQAMKG